MENAAANPLSVTAPFASQVGIRDLQVLVVFLLLHNQQQGGGGWWWWGVVARIGFSCYEKNQNQRKHKMIAFIIDLC